MATFRAVYANDQLYRYALQAVPPIHIIVNNGKVTLVGVVATQADKDVAGMMASRVFGVFSVTNNLTVESKKGKS
jgi:hyperosmotically inducible protein